MTLDPWLQGKNQEYIQNDYFVRNWRNTIEQVLKHKKVNYPNLYATCDPENVSHYFVHILNSVLQEKKEI